ncbi:hypothetical protein CEXT_110521 [Caerostris extrusa]|uniref:Maturase K n=1 Tax=Caerostris extrusa TaxID=172846 RepID=A0AAV4STS7_CAEEX|nr:hypothetical protein CEXT_110521 [Caerostris extrusa]
MSQVHLFYSFYSHEPKGQTIISNLRISFFQLHPSQLRLRNLLYRDLQFKSCDLSPKNLHISIRDVGSLSLPFRNVLFYALLRLRAHEKLSREKEHRVYVAIRFSIFLSDLRCGKTEHE